MNKLLLAMMGSGLILGAPAQNITPLNTVLQAMTFQDDTPVILRVKIDSPLGKGKYQFSDNTGTIVLDIDDEVIGNMEILSEDIFEIHGDVDKGWFSTEIDVEEIDVNLEKNK